jgi:hypothetical protein
VLDRQITTLRLRRAVLSTVAKRGNTIEETLIMHKLARLSARERQQIIDEFVEAVFQGASSDTPAMGIARGMRQLPAELPDDPAPDQVDAWIEPEQRKPGQRRPEQRKAGQRKPGQPKPREPASRTPTTALSPNTPDRPWRAESLQARPKARRCLTASSRQTPRPSAGQRS